MGGSGSLMHPCMKASQWMRVLLWGFLLGASLARAQDAPLPSSLPMSLMVNGQARAYWLYVPQSLNASSAQEKAPLFVVLHGGFTPPKALEQSLSFDALAEKERFIVAYPSAYRPPPRDWLQPFCFPPFPRCLPTARWNDGRTGLPSEHLGVDDVAFLKAVVEDVSQKAPVDRSRVFLAGVSNGGVMTYRIACETPGVFAAVAAVSANMAEEVAATCALARPVAFLAIHGDEDPMSPFGGGDMCNKNRRGPCKKGSVISNAESVEIFARANGCAVLPVADFLPQKVDDGTMVERHVYQDCAPGGEVVRYIVWGGGHGWPPVQNPFAFYGRVTQNLDATETIARFFLERM